MQYSHNKSCEEKRLDKPGSFQLKLRFGAFLLCIKDYANINGNFELLLIRDSRFDNAIIFRKAEIPLVII